MVALKMFTYAEVSKHNKATDCWLVIRDNVYDVTSFVDQHPGGNMIFLNAGRESTYLFESYHPERVKALLSKFLIGRIEDTDIFRVKFIDDEADLKIYGEMKNEVQKYFKEQGKNPRVCPAMYYKSLFIMVSYLLTFYGAYIYFDVFWMACICAVLTGFFAAEVGICIQHDANHGAFHKNPRINKWAGVSLDFVGASSFMWKQQHVFGHHVYTNISSLDPDIRVKDPDVRRATPMQPWREYQMYQHLYLGFLYGSLAIKSIFIDDFTMLQTGKVGEVPINHLHFDELLVFWIGKAFYFAYYFLFPLFCSPHGIWDLIKLWLIAQFTTGWVLAFMFQVNHLTDKAEFYEKDGDHLDTGWTRSQIESTSDFSHGSWFWTYISGGLNYQVVHHLFPWICHLYYPEIAPIIKDICKKHGISYKCYPSFLAALKGHFTHLKRIGQGIKLD